MFTFAFCILLYFLPSIVGHEKRSFTGIFLVNLFLGWTFIGWIVALVWACTDDPREPVYSANWVARRREPVLQPVRRDGAGGRAILLGVRFARTTGASWLDAGKFFRER